MSARRLVAAFGVALAALAATALWLERQSIPAAETAAYVWGSGLERSADPPPDEMVQVAAGEYVLGDDWREPASDAPRRRIQLDAFSIDRHEVTNRQFDRFVRRTNYVTTAERTGGAWIYRDGERDWTYVRGADWQHPLGPESRIDHAMDHPVVLVSWHDATAYAAWAGKRLPTEGEWEVAARAGTVPVIETVGLPNPAEDASANVWQGHWPQRNELLDGYFYTAPVGSFPPNDLGLYDMIGNVWEWTADWYTPGQTAGRRVARGGSWFCSANYCSAYRPGFRGKSPPNRAFNNVGFRCASDAAGPAS